MLFPQLSKPLIFCHRASSSNHHTYQQKFQLSFIMYNSITHLIEKRGTVGFVESFPPPAISIQVAIATSDYHQNCKVLFRHILGGKVTCTKMLDRQKMHKNLDSFHQSHFSSLIDRFQSVLLILEKGIIFLPIGYPISIFMLYSFHQDHISDVSFGGLNILTIVFAWNQKRP